MSKRAFLRSVFLRLDFVGLVPSPEHKRVLLVKPLHCRSCKAFNSSSVKQSFWDFLAGVIVLRLMVVAVLFVRLRLISTFLLDGGILVLTLGAIKLNHKYRFPYY